MLGKTIAVTPKVMPDSRIAKLITAGNKVPRPMPSASSSIKWCSVLFEIEIYVYEPQNVLTRKKLVKVSVGIIGKPSASDIDMRNETMMQKLMVSVESICSPKHLNLCLKIMNS